MTKAAQQWIEQEFAGLNLGDARLDKRARKLMERLAANPTASIPQACDSWSETCAAYRFLRNTDVAWESILEPHWASTQERMRTQPVVLCIQDTTELDFNGQEIDGLGPLNYEARRGLYLHPTYAVTTEREPLGVLDARNTVAGSAAFAVPMSKPPLYRIFPQFTSALKRDCPDWTRLGLDAAGAGDDTEGDQP